MSLVSVFVSICSPLLLNLGEPRLLGLSNKSGKSHAVPVLDLNLKKGMAAFAFVCLGTFSRHVQQER